MAIRLLITSAFLLGAFGYLAQATKAEAIAPRQSLKTLPLQLVQWRGRDEPRYIKAIEDQLGVDEYVTRTYFAPAQPAVGLYVGFYQSQRQGDTMHSPLNCLPGAGWQPVQQDRASFDVSDSQRNKQSITVNEFVIQKGIDRQVVLYWYQSHGRVVASEYTSKLYLIADAIRLNRTDAAMIRVMTNIAGEGKAAEDAARQRAREFVQQMFPALTTVLPS
jgi:EpsI family protein